MTTVQRLNNMTIKAKDLLAQKRVNVDLALNKIYNGIEAEPEDIISMSREDLAREFVLLGMDPTPPNERITRLLQRSDSAPEKPSGAEHVRPALRTSARKPHQEIPEMFELMDTAVQNAVIKVIGVGGGGCNAVNHMMSAHIDGIEFICANTDAQALQNVSVKNVLQLGAGVTKGLGAGADPEIGRKSAEEDRERIRDSLEGADMVFVTAGMGGGTGTGAAPVVAEVAKELGILTVAIVTKPFPFEGGKRGRVAANGIAELAKHVDSLITIPNEKLLQVLGKEMTLLSAFGAANDVLLNATQGIAELITRPGLINVDFADVKTVMSDMGVSMIGVGSASGENRAREAAEAAINSPLLEDIDLAGARGVLVNITAGLSLSIGEYDEVGNTVRDFADDEATIVVGTVIDPEMEDEIRVTVVATGLGARCKAKESGEPVMRLVSSRAADAVPPDYHVMEQPAYIRNKRVARAAGAGEEAWDKDLDYLDIPAFLRRQAD
jgi:cell division protein FtsZ